MVLTLFGKKWCSWWWPLALLLKRKKAAPISRRPPLDEPAHSSLSLWIDPVEMGVDGDGEKGGGAARRMVPKSPSPSSGCVCTLTPRPLGPANLQARWTTSGGGRRGSRPRKHISSRTRRPIPPAPLFPIAFHKLYHCRIGGEKKLFRLMFSFWRTLLPPQESSLKSLSLLELWACSFYNIYKSLLLLKYFRSL